MSFDAKTCLPTQAVSYLAAEKGSEGGMRGDGQDGLSWSGWDSLAWRFARGLRALGVNEYDDVQLMCDTASWIRAAVSYVGTQRAGACPVPIAPDVEFERRRRAILVDCIAPPNASRGRGRLTFEFVLGCGEGRRTPMSLPRSARDGLFTSGTTAQPTLVRSSTRVINFRRTSSENGWRRVSYVRLHSLAPSTHAGLHGMLLSLLRHGHTDLILPNFRASRFCDLVASESVSAACVLPFQMRLIARADELAMRLASLRMMTSVGDMLDPVACDSLLAALPHLTILNSYGRTEAGTTQLSTAYSAARPTAVANISWTGAARV